MALSPWEKQSLCEISKMLGMFPKISSLLMQLIPNRPNQTKVKKKKKENPGLIGCLCSWVVLEEWKTTYRTTEEEGGRPHVYFHIYLYMGNQQKKKRPKRGQKGHKPFIRTFRSPLKTL